MDEFDDDAHGRTKFTATDAFSCKVSATNLGYYSDKYLESMRQLKSDVRKQPIINRGYFTRVYCLQTILGKFLESTNSSAQQVINIGAGYDTTAFNLIEKALPNLHVFEIDFPDIIKRKVDLFLKSHEIRGLLGTDKPGLDHKTNYGYDFGQLRLIGCDLHSSSNLVDLLREAGLNVSVPTLVMTECVLVYMDRPSTTALCSDIMGLFPEGGNVAWVSYDMVNPDDAFGKMMRRNLESAAGFRLPGFRDFPTVDSRAEIYTSTGCDVGKCVTMLQAYERIVPAAEKARISRLELMDEVEEWMLLMSHYCLSVGVKGDDLRIIAGIISTVEESEG